MISFEEVLYRISSVMLGQSEQDLSRFIDIASLSRD